MPFALTYPNINGHRFSPASCEITIAGFRMLGVLDLTYSDSLEPGRVPSNGTPMDIGRTVGKQKPTASMTLLKLEWVALIKRLGKGFGERPFLVGVSMFEPGPNPPSFDEIVGCRITKPEITIAATSTDAIAVKVEMDPMYIKYDGLVIADPRGLAI
jgi:hypothetical protein